MFRRTAAKLAQNHHETGQYRRLFSVYSGHSANANAFPTFPHAPKPRPERPCDTASTGFEGKPEADQMPPLTRSAAKRITASPVVPSSLFAGLGRQFFQHPELLGINQVPSASYLRTNMQAISYGRAGGVAAPLPREFFLDAETGWDTGTADLAICSP